MLKTLKLSFITLFSIAIFTFASGVASADTMYYPTKSNGYKVYLSPALHSPDNTGCNGFLESANAKATATESAKDLQAMGYTVRLGTGTYTQNISNSNAWGAALHVPLHSNAGTLDCSGTTASRGGTVTIYEAGGSTAVASKLLAAMRYASPGTSDKMIPDTDTAPGSLWELRQANKASGYMETGFHTYGPDATWMTNNRGSIGQYLTNGIHSYTGANDCRTQTCMIASSFETLTTDAISSVVIPKKPDIVFNVNTHGRQFAELKQELNGVMTGNKKDSVITKSMAKSLQGVSIDENGTLVVDFKDFRKDVASPGSYTRGAFLGELYNAVFKFPEVKEVYFTFDGNFTSWYDWLQITPEPMTKQE